MQIINECWSCDICQEQVVGSHRVYPDERGPSHHPDGWLVVYGNRGPAIQICQRHKMSVMSPDSSTVIEVQAVKNGLAVRHTNRELTRTLDSFAS